MISTLSPSRVQRSLLFSSRFITRETRDKLGSFTLLIYFLVLLIYFTLLVICLFLLFLLTHEVFRGRAPGQGEAKTIL